MTTQQKGRALDQENAAPIRSGKRSHNNTRSKGNQPSVTMRKAIDQHCKQCIYDPAEHGRWREQVEQCTCSNCSLWSCRPKKRQRAGFQATNRRPAPITPKNANNPPKTSASMAFAGNDNAFAPDAA